MGFEACFIFILFLTQHQYFIDNARAGVGYIDDECAVIVVNIKAAHQRRIEITANMTPTSSTAMYVNQGSYCADDDRYDLIVCHKWLPAANIAINLLSLRRRGT